MRVWHLEVISVYNKFVMLSMEVFWGAARRSTHGISELKGLDTMVGLCCTATIKGVCIIETFSSEP